jgi:hypothetical protein
MACWCFFLAYCRGDHVWWPLATIRMLSDYWRAESNISMLPGKDGWLFGFLFSLLLCVPVMERSFPPRWIKPSLAVCSWAPDHGAYSERRIPPQRAGEAPNAERQAGGDLARLGAPRAQPWACSDAPQTTEKAAPWPVALGPYRINGSVICTVCREGSGIPLCCSTIVHTIVIPSRRGDKTAPITWQAAGICHGVVVNCVHSGLLYQFIPFMIG